MGNACKMAKNYGCQVALHKRLQFSLLQKALYLAVFYVNVSTEPVVGDKEILVLTGKS